jgi:hypothetical protein
VKHSRVGHTHTHAHAHIIHPVELADLSDIFCVLKNNFKLDDIVELFKFISFFFYSMV